MTQLEGAEAFAFCSAHFSLLLGVLLNLVQGGDGKLQKEAFIQMRTTITAATSTMTSVPKPLKFLLPHYQTLKDEVEKITDADVKVRASIRCCLALAPTIPARQSNVRASERWAVQLLGRLRAMVGG